MTAPTITVRRVHDEDASFWNLCCTGCSYEGYAYDPGEVQDVIDEHLDTHEEADQ